MWKKGGIWDWIKSQLEVKNVPVFKKEGPFEFCRHYFSNSITQIFSPKILLGVKVGAACLEGKIGYEFYSPLGMHVYNTSIQLDPPPTKYTSKKLDHLQVVLN